MALSGATRGAGGAALVRHLLNAEHNEEVRLGPSRGLVAEGDLRAQMRELEALGAHGRTRKPLYHVHFDPHPDHPLPTEEQRADFWARLEAKLGLECQPFTSVFHVKHGRWHEHRVYLTVREDGTAVRLSHDYAKREAVQRAWEYDHGIPFGPGYHERAVLNALRYERPDVHRALVDDGYTFGPRAIAALTPDERHQQERTTISLAEVRATTLAAWTSTNTAPAFRDALADHGLVLAQGSKGPVVVDQAGAVHSVARLIGAASRASTGQRITAAEVKARLDGFPLPSLAEAKQQQQENAHATQQSHALDHQGPEGRPRPRDATRGNQSPRPVGSGPCPVRGNARGSDRRNDPRAAGGSTRRRGPGPHSPADRDVDRPDGIAPRDQRPDRCRADRPGRDQGDAIRNLIADARLAQIGSGLDDARAVTRAALQQAQGHRLLVNALRQPLSLAWPQRNLRGGETRRKAISMDSTQDQTWGIGSSQPWATWDWEGIDGYWKRLGYAPRQQQNFLEIETGTGHVIRDYGDRIEISGGPPANEQISQMVAAARERGWRGMHFFGSDEFQQRAKLEALRQGWPPESITLECEREQPPLIACHKMPEHLRRRLGIPDQNQAPKHFPAPEQSHHHAPAPQPRAR